MCTPKPLFFGLLAALTACTTPPDAAEPDPVPVEEECAYPLTERFAVGEAAPPFAWADAYNEAGETIRFDLVDAHYERGFRDPFTLLAFIAVPSW